MRDRNKTRNFKMKGDKKRDMRIKSNEKGITLIYLIITIIILVILAAVSIRAVANMGIVGYAVNGTQDYARQAKAENQMLGETINLINSTLGRINEIQGGSESISTGAENNDVQMGSTGLKPLVNKDTVSDYVTGTALQGEDRYGNPITIPVGFKVASDSGADVTQGIVIMAENRL